MATGVAILPAGIGLIALGYIVAGAVILLLANQFAMCDRVTTAVRRIQAPTREEKEHWLETGKGIGYREGRRSAKPIVIPLRPSNHLDSESEFLSS